MEYIATAGEEQITLDDKQFEEINKKKPNEMVKIGLNYYYRRTVKIYDANSQQGKKIKQQDKPMTNAMNDANQYLNQKKPESKNPEDLDRYSPYRADLLQVFLTSYPLEDYDREEEIRACDRLIKKYTFEKAKAMAEYAVSDQYPHFLRKATQLEKYQDQVIEHKKVNDNYE